jgi:coenzyme F420-reducing hydrogenase delta subunit
VSGNDKAARRVAAVKKVLEEIGIEPERVEMYHNSAAMGPQFAQTCIDFTERIRKLGPLITHEKKAAA